MWLPTLPISTQSAIRMSKLLISVCVSAHNKLAEEPKTETNSSSVFTCLGFAHPFVLLTPEWLGAGGCTCNATAQQCLLWEKDNLVKTAPASMTLDLTEPWVNKLGYIRKAKINLGSALLRLVPSWIMQQQGKSFSVIDYCCQMMERCKWRNQAKRKCQSLWKAKYCWTDTMDYSQLWLSCTTAYWLLSIITHY